MTAARKPILITGGAGFIGCNVADRLLSQGHPVLLYDNLSRPGVEQNAQWLQSRHGERVEIIVADVRDAKALRQAASKAYQAFHFAAQVAVTTSLTDPAADFEINARGTLNLLEALRSLDRPVPLVFTSTNKVYGALPDIPLRQHNGRYEPESAAIRATGIGEARPLDFHSPYGCSKGAADQYVLDYARTYRLPAAVFRMSCIYGPRQFGTEDQGWVAHFLIRALERNTITIYGDGMQVRDILFVEDLVEALLRAQGSMATISGEAFNIGGGPNNTISLRNLLVLIEELVGVVPDVAFEEWRPGDQKYYVTDTRKFQQATGWRARVDASQGIEHLLAWLCEQRKIRLPKMPPANAQASSATLSARGR